MSEANLTEHPVAPLEGSVLVLRGRATLAVVGLGAVMLARGADVAARAWSIPLIRAIPPRGVSHELMASIFVSFAAIFAAGLAITVVRGLTARAAERYRRMRETSPESLEEQGIDLGVVSMSAQRS